MKYLGKIYLGEDSIAQLHKTEQDTVAWLKQELAKAGDHTTAVFVYTDDWISVNTYVYTQGEETPSELIF